MDYSPSSSPSSHCREQIERNLAALGRGSETFTGLPGYEFTTWQILAAP